MTRIIASTAFIDPRATIGDDVRIGPYTFIGPHVTIGRGTVIENHVTIKGHTTLGRVQPGPPQCGDWR